MRPLTQEESASWVAVYATQSWVDKCILQWLPPLLFTCKGGISPQILGRICLSAAATQTSGGKLQKIAGHQ